jgi:hypothetical protein
MYINKLSKQFHQIVPNRQFYDTECPLDGHALEKALAVQAQSLELNEYLEEVYDLLRQGASPKGVKIPQCLDTTAEHESAPEQPAGAQGSSNKSPKMQKKTGSSLNTKVLSSSTNQG